jgi:UDP-glucose 4-epimerase
MHLLHALTAAARDGRAPHLVLGSSTLVYGARPENPVSLDESAPLAGPRDYALVGEKIDAERQAIRFHDSYGAPLTVLRTAPLLAPAIRTIAGRYLSLGAVPTVLGFNPMMQALALDDALEAAVLAVRRSESVARNDPALVVNVAPAGVLPLHAAIRLCGRRNVPIPAFAAATMMDALFSAGLAIAPGAHVAYLRYPCVADGGRARTALGFEPKQTTRDVIATFARTLVRAAA